MRDNRTLTKYVASFLFGDGCMCVDKRDWNKNGNAHFECSHIEKNLDYIEWKRDILENITSCTISRIEPRNKPFPNGKIANQKPQYRVRTSRHPFFNKFRERLYGTGKKILDPHYFTLFDEESLAIWYMDDGSLGRDIEKRNINKHYRLRVLLCTQSYTLIENLFIKDFLKNKFELEFNLNRIKYPSGLKYNLRLDYQDQVDKFIELVKPYILPSFYYKINSSRMIDSEKSDDDIV